MITILRFLLCLALRPLVTIYAVATSTKLAGYLFALQHDEALQVVEEFRRRFELGSAPANGAPASAAQILLYVYIRSVFEQGFHDAVAPRFVISHKEQRAWGVSKTLRAARQRRMYVGDVSRLFSLQQFGLTRLAIRAVGLIDHSDTLVLLVTALKAQFSLGRSMTDDAWRILHNRTTDACLLHLLGETTDDDSISNRYLNEAISERRLQSPILLLRLARHEISRDRAFNIPLLLEKAKATSAWLGYHSAEEHVILALNDALTYTGGFETCVSRIEQDGFAGFATKAGARASREAARILSSDSYSDARSLLLEHAIAVERFDPATWLNLALSKCSKAEYRGPHRILWDNPKFRRRVIRKFPFSSFPRSWETDFFCVIYFSTYVTDTDNNFPRAQVIEYAIRSLVLPDLVKMTSVNSRIYGDETSSFVSEHHRIATLFSEDRYPDWNSSAGQNFIWVERRLLTALELADYRPEITFWPPFIYAVHEFLTLVLARLLRARNKRCAIGSVTDAEDYRGTLIELSGREGLTRCLTLLDHNPFGADAHQDAVLLQAWKQYRDLAIRGLYILGASMDAGNVNLALFRFSQMPEQYIHDVSQARERILTYCQNHSVDLRMAGVFTFPNVEKILRRAGLHGRSVVTFELSEVAASLVLFAEGKMERMFLLPDEAAPIAKAVAAWRALVSRLHGTLWAKSSLSDVERAIDELSRAMSPITAAIDKFLCKFRKTTFYFVGSGEARDIPLAACVLRRGSRHYYLIQCYTIKVLPNLRLLNRLPTQKPHGGSFCIFHDDHGLELPGAAQEVGELYTAVQGRFEPLLFRRISDPAAVAAMQNAAVLHIVGHGRIQFNDPLSSAIELSPGNAITSLSLLSLDLAKAQLVTISACSPALAIGRVRHEPLSVTLLFLCLGADGVISPICDIHDRPTAALMGRVYSHLMDLGLSTGAESLRRAQMDCIDGRCNEVSEATVTRGLRLKVSVAPTAEEDEIQTSSPAFWASFQYYGL